MYVLAVRALISYALSQPPRAATGFHYSFWFSLSTLLILGAWVNWTLMLRRYQPGRDLSTPLLISILVCIVSIAVLSPLALVEPVDRPVGFFNEKGLAGCFLASVSCLYVALRRDALGWTVFALSAVFSLVVLESGRSLLFYAVAGTLALETSSLRWRVAAMVVALAAGTLLVDTDFFKGQMHKIDLLTQGSGELGRYAAAKIVSETSWAEVLVGHGYGSYLSYRAALLPLPEGLEYDYGGSLWLELIFEIGLVATLLMVFLVSRLVFARISVLTDRRRRTVGQHWRQARRSDAERFFSGTVDCAEPGTGSPRQAHSACRRESATHQGSSSCT